MITSIALMQLVEQGKADLDSSDQLEKVVPEMAEVQIIEGVDSNGKEILREKKNRITLRMLQTHTGKPLAPLCQAFKLTSPAGFGYTFFSSSLWSRINKDLSLDELQASLANFKQPLEFEPGTSRAYGLNIDWVGVYVERVSGLSLGDYFQKYIFSPLGIHNTAFVMKGDMRAKMAGMHRRSEEGLRAIPHPYKSARVDTKDEEIFHSGGGGLLSNAPDYCRTSLPLPSPPSQPAYET